MDELIAKQSYGIKPQENAPAVMPYTFDDYILTCGEITYQACGLNKKIDKPKLVDFLALICNIDSYRKFF